MLKPIYQKQKPIDSKATGERARAYRLAAGVTLAQVAKRMPISAVMIQNLETGVRTWKEGYFEQFIAAVDAAKEPKAK